MQIPGLARRSRNGWRQWAARSRCRRPRGRVRLRPFDQGCRERLLARENLRVADSARDLANQALKRAQRELELGALSPLDIYNPQQQYATSQIGVSQAQYFLKETEDALRRQMGADLDPQIRTL